VEKSNEIKINLGKHNFSAMLNVNFDSDESRFADFSRQGRVGLWLLTAEKMEKRYPGVKKENERNLLCRYVRILFFFGRFGATGGFFGIC
jgi:hypothetical protein